MRRSGFVSVIVVSAARRAHSTGAAQGREMRRLRAPRRRSFFEFSSTVWSDWYFAFRAGL